MIPRFHQLIQREIRNAKKGKPAEIIIKVNNLQERDMISRLYNASKAGVKVKLLVRSICCLAPGIEGMSENITVHRIVDRYLEHARVFVFHNNGKPEYFMGSADWMNRNLHSRIEVCFPVRKKELCEEIESILRLQLADNTKAVYFTAEAENQKIETAEGEERVQAQQQTYLLIR
jgi:polyphosphate kinase